MKLERNAAIGIALLIFFFNDFLLPGNLQVVFLTVPFVLYAMHTHGELRKLILPLGIICAYTLIHLIIGANIAALLPSTAVLIVLLIFLFGFFSFYKRFSNFDDIFRILTYFNAIFTFFALISLMSGVLFSVFWYTVPFTSGYDVIPRLKLFHLEASHYSFAIMPLFFYYFWKFLNEWGWKNLFLLASLSVSLILSFSLGILSVIGITLLLVICFRFFSLIKYPKTRISLFIFGGIISVISLCLFVIFPDNPLLFRIQNLFLGNDTSGRGRTYEAFEIGWLVLQDKNPFFGIGLGQFKLVGRDVLIYYYRYMNTPEVVRLPNAMAETLVATGILGALAKLVFQGILFVKKRVFSNLFQLSLFIALFLYQFTGSYLFNAMEYVLWIMVFVPKLSEFDQSKYFAK